MNVVPIIIILFLFMSALFAYTKEKADTVSISILAAIIACAITIYFSPTLETTVFLQYIEFKALIFIISMQVIVQIADKNKIFQYISVKAIHLTKANPRRFFYLICLLASITAAVMEDIMITMIYIPGHSCSKNSKNESGSFYLWDFNLYEFGVYSHPVPCEQYHYIKFV